MKKRILSLFLLLTLLVCPAAMAQEEGTTYPLTLTEGKDATIQGMTFDGDVTISGDRSKLLLIDCTINGDLILTADEGTMVMLFGTTVTGQCIQRNSVKEANMDYPLPKFASDSPINVVCEDCIGGVIALHPEVPVTFNQQEYTLQDATLFIDPTSESFLVPYEGQEANLFFVVHWWEGGEEVLEIMAEFDPGA